MLITLSLFVGVYLQKLLFLGKLQNSFLYPASFGLYVCNRCVNLSFTFSLSTSYNTSIVYFEV